MLRCLEGVVVPPIALRSHVEGATATYRGAE
jgi:hypothetical protein